MKKRITAICTAVCMLAGVCVPMLPAENCAMLHLTAYAEDDYTEEDYEGLAYHFYSDHAEVYSLAVDSTLADENGEVTIPAEVKGLPVTKVASSAFGNFGRTRPNSKIKSIILPDTIEGIESYAFNDSDLEDINFPSSLKYIAPSAFQNTPFLEKLNQDSGMIIANDTLYYVSEKLSSVIIPEGVKHIASQITLDQGSVLFPNTLEEIAEGTVITLDSTRLFPESIKKIGKHCLKVGQWTYMVSVIIKNPDCEIDPEAFNILNGNMYKSGVSLYCPEDSAVQKYAEEQGYSHYSLEDAPGITAYSGGCTFSVYSDHAEVTSIYGSNLGETGKYTIPDSVWGVPVTSIGYNARCSSEIKSLTIPASITTIREKAFSGGSELAEIIFEDRSALNWVDKDAFSGTKWWEDNLTGDTVKSANGIMAEVTDCPANFVIPDGIWMVAANVFKETSTLETLTVPGGTSISRQAFSDCNNLKTVTFLSGGHTTIGNYAFDTCKNMEKIIFENDDCTIYPDAGTFSTYYWNYNKTYDLDAVIYGNEGSPAQSYAEQFSRRFRTLDEIPPDKGSYEGYISYNKYKDHITITSVDLSAAPSLDIVIPAEIEGLPVTAVSHFGDGSNPWEGIPYKWTIELPDTITELPKECFSQCMGLTGVKLPAGLTALPDSCFSWCENLKTVELPSKLTAIPEWGFLDCAALEEITIPDTVTEIGVQAFAGCSKLKKITLPAALETIGGGAFNADDLLTEIHIPAKVKEIGGGALATNVLADASNYKIYEDGSLNPDDYDSKTRLSAITVDAGNPYFTANDGVLYNKDMTEIIAVPDGKTGVLTVPDTVKKIAAQAFCGCTTVTEIKLPDGLEEVGDYGITRTGIQSLTLPDSLKTIGTDAFSDNIRLKTVQFPKNITEIPVRALANGKALESVVIPDTVRKIGEAAFNGCTALAEINIPDSLLSVGGGAFGQKYDDPYSPDARTAWLKKQTEGNTTVIADGILLQMPAPQDGNLVIPDGVRVVGELMFNYNTKITSVTLPEGVEGISDGALISVWGRYYIPDQATVTELVFPSSVKYIGAYGSTPGLQSVTVRSTDCEIAEGAFATGVEYDQNGNASYQYNSECIVYCAEGSTAQDYAEKHGLKTAALPEIPKPVSGDCNGDGSVTVADAVLLARFNAEDNTLTAKQISDILVAEPDQNADNLISVLDVRALLKKLDTAQ